jgi:hypothetical protein
MPSPEISEFAELLLRDVRYQAIVSCDNLLDPGANNVISNMWRSKIAAGLSEELATTMIPDCIDQTIFFLLHAIDEGLLRLSFVASNGSVVDLKTDGEGEMAGCYADGSWRAIYSKERFVDYFSDLDLGGGEGE